MSRATLVLTLSIAIAAAILAILLAPLSWAKNTTGGGLIGERPINTLEDAHACADEALAGAASIWDEDSSGWEVTQRVAANDGDSNAGGGLIVEARRITEGSFASSGILLTRARSVIDLSTLGRGDHTADSVFEFMTSPEGFQVIDPVSDVEEFSKYVERFAGWREGVRGERGAAAGPTRLEVADAYADLGPALAKRMFVVLNAIDARNRVMVSKSVLHRDRPGASAYYSGSDPSQHRDAGAAVGQVRALNTFGLRVREVIDETAGGGDHREGSRSVISVEMINWADLGLHSSLLNWVNCKLFFGGVFDRLRVALDEK